jgi:hypothetical protein
LSFFRFLGALKIQKEKIREQRKDSRERNHLFKEDLQKQHNEVENLYHFHFLDECFL